MKKKHTEEVTLSEVKEALDQFKSETKVTFSEVHMTLEEFKGTLDEFKSETKATFGEIRASLAELGEALGFVIERMVTKEDLKEQLKGFATKDDLHKGLFTLQTQMNGIESDIRDIKRACLRTSSAR